MKWDGLAAECAGKMEKSGQGATWIRRNGTVLNFGKGNISREVGSEGKLASG